jgi:hypothetical protein
MSGKVIALAVVGCVVAVVVWLAAAVIGTSNSEVDLRTAIEQKQRDNSSEYDNMWKKISQVAQVTQAQKNALKEIFEGHAAARTQGSDDNLVMKWIKESVPNVDLSTFNNLQNVITGSRDSFTFRQKELLDLKREHDRLLRRFPSGMILSMFGRKPIDVVIVTSSRSEDAFKTGKDDDVSVFGGETKKGVEK